MISSKRLRQFLTPSKRPGIIVASIGRSGSTLLYRSVAEAMSMARFSRIRGRVFDEAWDLADSTLLRGTVYKTHDHPAALAGRQDLRSLFVFGQPSDIARSVVNQRATHGDAWVAEHLAHMHADGPYEALFERDVLRLESQLDAWSTFTASPVLCVRYEALWDALDEIRAFTGLPVELPERRERESKLLGDEEEAALRSVYGALDARVAAMPDVFQPT
ncbi:MAG: hypothetical protein HKO95_06020 [Rhodobacteraceae bacterium]|nr:hypothetical protein [Alphaproteobacteria bacterium]NNF71331.1 hypothetical protein [Paracoccaceae bacterium]NNK66275.1 hypothetical protein [Paracoccaceae bacterium]